MIIVNRIRNFSNTISFMTMTVKMKSYKKDRLTEHGSRSSDWLRFKLPGKYGKVIRIDLIDSFSLPSKLSLYIKEELLAWQAYFKIHALHPITK